MKNIATKNARRQQEPRVRHALTSGMYGAAPRDRRHHRLNVRALPPQVKTLKPPENNTAGAASQPEDADTTPLTPPPKRLLKRARHLATDAQSLNHVCFFFFWGNAENL